MHVTQPLSNAGIILSIPEAFQNLLNLGLHFDEKKK